MSRATENREEILKNSPDDNKDFFVVPKVVE
jgi:Asp-tRNA(Asn)/Glu-tRNA(Gln) amidotransferase C subunit